MNPPLMDVTLVKAAGPGDRDRAWLTVAGVTRRGPVYVVHDRPHLAVESLFGIDDGLWAELAAADHAAAGHAGHGPRPGAPEAGADRLRGSSRRPGHDVVHPRAPSGQDESPTA